jgi:hypothetical protein
MRSWLAVLLLVLLPLQFSWAAMGAHAPHERGPVAGVVCPHFHGLDSAPQLEAGAAHHADCGACHNGCALAVFHGQHPMWASPAPFPLASAAWVPASRPADLPDRPQWSARG